jgi:hypothetical protein
MNFNKSIPLSLFTLLLMTGCVKGLANELVKGLVMDSTPTQCWTIESYFFAANNE